MCIKPNSQWCSNQFAAFYQKKKMKSAFLYDLKKGDTSFWLGRTVSCRKKPKFKILQGGDGRYFLKHFVKKYLKRVITGWGIIFEVKRTGSLIWLFFCIVEFAPFLKSLHLRDAIQERVIMLEKFFLRFCLILINDYWFFNFRRF